MSRTRLWLVVVLPTALFVALVVTVTAGAIKKPFYNWDVIGYVATAFRFEGLQGDELLAATRSELAAGIHDERKNTVLLRGSSPYQATVVTDPRSLEQQLPFYSPRVLYVAGIVVLHKLGMSAVAASVWLSAVPLAALTMFLWWVIQRRAGAWLAGVFVGAAAYGLYWPMLATLSTPDALGTLFSIAGSVALCRAHPRRSDLVVVAALFALAVLTRHDALLHILMFAPAAVWATRGSASLRELAGRVAAVVVPTIVVYLIAASFTGWYGRQTVLVYAFIGPMAYPADTPVPDVSEPYWATLFANLRGFATRPWFYRELWPIALAALAWRWASPGLRLLMLVGVLELVARFILFPVTGVGWLRIYMTPIVLTMLFAGEAILASRRAGSGNSVTPAG
ncbi:MAG: hypothetical protein JNL28_16550 [Planctomycetes bacterium]|nr:hypothetical protein [Planctomycetota bacterium]